MTTRSRSYVTVTDQFCGAGGSSIGATAAGGELVLALNHWELAIETHNTNFPDAYHECTDVSACDPRRYPSTDILITSPECTNHSLARGRSRRFQQPGLWDKPDPAEERSRATMWDVPRFAEFHRYQLIVVENVVEARKWVTWDAWLHAMRLLGYDHEVVYLNSMFCHPTPQTRDRLYVVFWRRGNPRPDLDIRPTAFCPACGQDVAAVQTWKRPVRWGRYGKNRQYIYTCPTCHAEVTPYYYAALNAVDWSLPAPRIGDRARPLRERTLERIRAGLARFGGQPVLMDHVHKARDGRDGDMTWPTTVPQRTVIGQRTHSLIVPPPFLVDLAYSHALNRTPRSVDGPMPTQTARPEHGLVIPPFLVNYYGTSDASSLDAAHPTVAGNHHQALCVPPFVVSYYTRVSGDKAALASLTDALPVQPGRPVHYLVQPDSTPAVEDCGFRMIQPHEIHRAMAFPPGYTVLGNQRDQVKQYGNAVTPPAMQLLMDRCMATLAQTAA